MSEESQDVVKAGRPEVIRASEGKVSIRIKLSPGMPPGHWKEFFRTSQIARPPDFDPPPASMFIEFSAPENDLERYVEHVMARIADANRRWNEEVRPRLDAEAEREQREAEDRARRVEEAQRRIDQMMDPMDTDDGR